MFLVISFLILIVSVHGAQPSEYKVTHAVLMGFAYAILIPIFVLLSRYGKQNGEFESVGSFSYYFGETWKYHVCCMSVCVCCAWTGFVIAMTHMGGREQLHAKVGILLIVLTTLQFLLGVVRFLIPKQSHNEFLGIVRIAIIRTHQVLGVSLVVIGLMNVQLGMSRLEVQSIWHSVFYSWLALLAVIIVLLEARKYRAVRANYLENTFRRHIISHQRSPLAVRENDDL